MEIFEQMIAVWIGIIFGAGVLVGAGITLLLIWIF